MIYSGGHSWCLWRSKCPINITHYKAVIQLLIFSCKCCIFGFFMLPQDGHTRARHSASLQTHAGCYLQEKCRPVAGANTITVWVCVCACMGVHGVRIIRAIAWGDEDSARLTSVQMTRDGHSITSTVSLKRSNLIQWILIISHTFIDSHD